MVVLCLEVVYDQVNVITGGPLLSHFEPALLLEIENYAYQGGFSHRGLRTPLLGCCFCYFRRVCLL